MTATPISFSWVDPTTNTDGTPIAAGEILGYMVGIRNTAAAGSVVGTYPYILNAAGATAASALLSSLAPALAAGTYAAAVCVNTGPGVPNSAWTPEVTFTVAPPVPPIPSPPTGFTVA
jgi:hypothetical protein